jgi:hypothetical protein
MTEFVIDCKTKCVTSDCLMLLPPDNNKVHKVAADHRCIVVKRSPLDLKSSIHQGVIN